MSLDVEFICVKQYIDKIIYSIWASLSDFILEWIHISPLELFMASKWKLSLTVYSIWLISKLSIYLSPLRLKGRMTALRVPLVSSFFCDGLGSIILYVLVSSYPESSFKALNSLLSFVKWSNSSSSSPSIYISIVCDDESTIGYLNITFDLFYYKVNLILIIWSV